MLTHLLRCCLFIAILGINTASNFRPQLEKPNILWITSEDMNAFIGAYGDALAHTPNLDKLASVGVKYTHAFATAPVCSPSRSCLITGVYATSLGTQHLRSVIEIPKKIRPFPKYLQQAGYYCSNRGKMDYNFVDRDIWDDESPNAHWRNRPEGKPFFSVFNIMTTHQSQIFGTDEAFHKRYGSKLTDAEKQDPDKMNIPPYHFDSPTVRKLWARYYECVALMDREVGRILAELEADGLADNTLVFYYSDHGTGMPRSKRALYDSGLRVPLIIRAPKKWQKELGLVAGSSNSELVNFADFAPTVLHLAGIDIPDYMEGIPFLGKGKKTQEYAFGHADRVDEAYEIARTVRGKKYRYIRNYLPHLPLIQDNFYTDQSEIMKELRRIKAEGKFTPAQQSMWLSRRKAEELYDTENDPYETNNLAGNPAYIDILTSMRKAQEDWSMRTFDSGLIPEAYMHQLAKEKGESIYEVLKNEQEYPLADILHLSQVQIPEKWNEKALQKHARDPNPVLRYWAAFSYQMHDWKEEDSKRALIHLLSDEIEVVRMTAAQSLCAKGICKEAMPVLLQGFASENEQVRLLAARMIEELSKNWEELPQEVLSYIDKNCPQKDWSKYYPLYTCWSLDAAKTKLEN